MGIERFFAACCAAALASCGDGDTTWPGNEASTTEAATTTHTEGGEEGTGGAAEASTSGATDESDGSDADTTGAKFDLPVPDGGPTASCAEAEELASNQGCEFWAVDLPQAFWGEGGTGAPEDGQFAVAIANTSTNASVDVRIFVGAAEMPIDGAIIEAGQMHLFELPALNIDAEASSGNGTAYRIESTEPVTAYQFNPLVQADANFSADASLLFPTHVLGGDYTTFTSDSIQALTQNGAGAYVAVVGVEDGTTVDVYTDVPLFAGTPAQGVVIDRGEVLTLVSAHQGGNTPAAGAGNLSGARVAADKPVAVFSGNVAALEPYGGKCCADHFEEQMMPLEAWGSRYVAAPPIHPQDFSHTLATYRVVGGEDGVALTYSPATPAGAPAAVDAYEVAYFQTDQAFTIESTKTFGIAQFHVGGLNHEPVVLPPIGDPSMVVLPAEDQWQDEYVFYVPPTYTNWVTLVRPAASATTLDGAPIAFVIGGTFGAYEFGQVAVEPGAHRIAGDAPFQILAYGYATFASYAFPGGSGVAWLSDVPPPPG